jgi:hypothetical protein
MLASLASLYNSEIGQNGSSDSSRGNSRMKEAGMFQSFLLL